MQIIYLGRDSQRWCARLELDKNIILNKRSYDEALSLSLGEKWFLLLGNVDDSKRRKTDKLVRAKRRGPRRVYQRGHVAQGTF